MPPPPLGVRSPRLGPTVVAGLASGSGLTRRGATRVRSDRRDTLNLTSEMLKRFDRVQWVLGDNRERMVKLEGSLEGLFAGRRDRDAA